MVIENTKTSKINSAIDIAKIAMAFLIIASHTKAFAFSYWLSKGFNIYIRLVIPFFTITSAYFFWRKEKPPIVFLRRLATLYIVWSLIYLPFDIAKLSQMSVGQIIRRFFWDGNSHGLWFLCGMIVGFIITYMLLKVFKPRQVLALGIIVLVIGTVKTSYSTAIYQLFGIRLPNYLGARNGLFYCFPYMSVGMAIAKSDNQGIFKHGMREFYIGFFISMLLVAVEGLLFVVHLKADVKILWLTVLPFAYCFFEIVLNTRIELDTSLSLMLRKMSTLMIVSHYLFIIAFRNYVTGMPLFLLTVLATTVFSYTVIRLSEHESLAFLRYLY